MALWYTFAMQITKLGHCCLVLEEAGTKIMTDPGGFTVEAQQGITGLDAILITHEHMDHFHIESVELLLASNPGAVVVTNEGVGKLLAAKGIAYATVGDGQSTTVKGLKIEGHGREHAPIYGDMGRVENTGYMIAERFYFPGDNYYAPGRAVDTLALPVAGPWMRIADAVEFAKAIKPRVAFGVHDGMMQQFFRSYPEKVMQRFVPEMEYVTLADGETREF